MAHTTWKLKSDKINGFIDISYLNGAITGIEFHLNAPLTDLQYTFFCRHIHFLEEDLMNCPHCIHMWQLYNAGASSNKIKMFCDYYFMFRKIKYKVTAAEAGKIKNIAINDSLLLKYFTSHNFLFKNKWSISNLVKYYNELRSEAYGAKAVHPDVFIKDYSVNLTELERQEYYKHLRSLGKKPVYDTLRNLVDFE